MNIRKIENGFTVNFYAAEDQWKENEKLYAFASWADAVNWIKDNEDKV